MCLTYFIHTDTEEEHYPASICLMDIFSSLKTININCKQHKFNMTKATWWFINEESTILSKQPLILTLVSTNQGDLGRAMFGNTTVMQLLLILGSM